MGPTMFGCSWPGYVERMNPIERTARRIDGFQQRHGPVGLLFAVNKKFGDDNAGSLVSNLAYSAFLALFPLLLLLVTLLGLVLSGDASLRQSVLHSTFADFPIIGRQLSDNIHALHRSSLLGLVIGLAGLLWGSIGFSQAGLFSMSQIWNLPGPARPNFPKRLVRSLAFLAVLALGLVVSTFLAAFGTFGSHDVSARSARRGPGCGHQHRPVPAGFPGAHAECRRGREDLVPGAFVGGVAWTVLLALGGYLVGHDLRGDTAVYGLFGMVLGLLAWIYLGAEMSLYAASSTRCSPGASAAGDGPAPADPGRPDVDGPAGHPDPASSRTGCLRRVHCTVGR